MSNGAAMFAFALYSFVTLLAMVNPVEAAAAFDTLTEGDPEPTRLAIARRSTIVAAVILLAFGFAGEAVLRALGVGLPAFQIAGGLLLLKVGFNMVFAQDTDAQDASAEKRAHRQDPSVFPLAIPIISGPGALTAIVTTWAKTHRDPMRILVVLVVTVLVFALTYITMRGSQWLTKRLGQTGVDAVGRLTGIIVAAIAIQLVIDGVQQLVRL
jgi:multiple antibiotic resistance protein